MSKHRKSFTLIELLVAMGVLALLVMLMLQLFSGTQRLWVASEKRNNIYADARVAMELMADLIGTVQFSYGEKLNSSTNAYERDAAQNMIFSLDTKSTDSDDGNSSNDIIFLAKTSRKLPKKDNYCRFISFRRLPHQEKTETLKEKPSRLLMVIYADKIDEDKFYKLFPPFDSSRDTMLGVLKGYFNTLVNNFKNSTGDGEDEYCQVIAENVVGFKLTAYALDGTGDNRKLKKLADSTDIKEPPYMLEIQISLLDRDNYKKWREISGDTAKKTFLLQHRRTFTRSVFIGNRWELETE